MAKELTLVTAERAVATCKANDVAAAGAAAF